MNALPLIALLLLALVGAALLGLRWMREARIARRLRHLGGAAEVEAGDSADLKYALPAMLAALCSRPSGRAELSEKMLQAGFHAAWHVDAFIIARVLFIGAAAAGALLFFEVDPRTVLSQPMPFFKFLIVLALCGRVPDWWLRDRAARNREKIIASVPQAVDFMTICVEAGLSLEDAFDKVSIEMRRSAPELAAEIKHTRSEMLMLDRTRALQRLKARSGVREIENFADALLQSIRFGTPLVDTLQSIASESRAEQISSLEEKAGAISARVGVPLIVMVLFPLVVLLAAPPIVAFLRNM